MQNEANHVKTVTFFHITYIAVRLIYNYYEVGKERPMLAYFRRNLESCFDHGHFILFLGYLFQYYIKIFGNITLVKKFSYLLYILLSISHNRV